jgi:hypothetical protein
MRNSKKSHYLYDKADLPIRATLSLNDAFSLFFHLGVYVDKGLTLSNLKYDFSAFKNYKNL